MDGHPYHQYFFFELAKEFYRLPEGKQAELKKDFHTLVGKSEKVIVVPYTTLGLKARTTFMLWCRMQELAHGQDFLLAILKSEFGQYLTLAYTYFGRIRRSEYSGRIGKPEQVMQNHEERLEYLILYPFTKTSEWYQLDAETRKTLMGEHIKVGLSHPDIRQSLLYAYGLDDYEFLLAYETAHLEEFQELIIEMRKTRGRVYTLCDTPIFTCLYKPLPELIEWL